MEHHDPLAPLASLPGLADAASRAVSSIARAHRRPAGLRAPDVISAESLLRGARATQDYVEGDKNGVVSAYSLLAPDLLATTVRTFSRAPLNLVARADVACGGDGVPAAGQAHRVQGLARLVASGAGVDFDRLAPAVVHAEIAAHRVCGPRSEVVARVVGRATAVHTGLDPRCFAVYENFLGRHRARYVRALESYAAGDVAPALVLLMDAWETGGAEADLIAQAAQA